MNNKTKEQKVIKTYFHPDAENEFIVSEFLTDDGVICKIVSMEEVLNNLITIPIRPLKDDMLLRKAEELLLGK